MTEEQIAMAVSKALEANGGVWEIFVKQMPMVALMGFFAFAMLAIVKSVVKSYQDQLPPIQQTLTEIKEIVRGCKHNQGK